MASLCVKVDKIRAQDAKMALLEHDLLDEDREPLHEGNSIYFAVLDGSEPEVKSILNVEFQFVTGKCPPSRKHRKGNLATLLSNVIPRDLAALIPRAFNIIGEIAILELSEQLAGYKNVIAEKLRELHPSLKAVYVKRSERAGEFRTSELDLAWGQDDPVTTHAENECKFRVDVKNAFFDPRLTHEHARIIDIVTDRARERGTLDVLDLFCGVGPFVIPLAKNPGVRSWAVDLNPRAIELLEANLKLNKIDPARVKCHAMDAKEFLERPDLDSRPPRLFDAIILNLPRKAHEFLQACHGRARPGTILFWYTIAQDFFDGKFMAGKPPVALIETLHGLEKSSEENEINELCPRGLEIVQEMGYAIKQITRVKPFSPYKYIYCFELQP